MRLPPSLAVRSRGARSLLVPPPSAAAAVASSPAAAARRLRVPARGRAPGAPPPAAAADAPAGAATAARRWVASTSVVAAPLPPPGPPLPVTPASAAAAGAAVGAVATAAGAASAAATKAVGEAAAGAAASGDRGAAPASPPPPPPPPPPSLSEAEPLSWPGLAVALAVGTGLLYYYSVEKRAKLTRLAAPTTTGKATLGGPFTLISAAGTPVTSTSFHNGAFMLLYFGFTACPDVCPEEMTKISTALVSLAQRGVPIGGTGGQGGSRSGTTTPAKVGINPVFVTIDAERDSPARADDYAKAFHPGWTGLGGSVAETTAAAKAYRVYFAKGDIEPDGGYNVDHSIITYLVNPAGEFEEFYGKNVGAAEMAARIDAALGRWRARGGGAAPTAAAAVGGAPAVAAPLTGKA
ncbi:hypothetical protein MMPV_000047 [Pyropia vietnamensis]